LNSRNDATDHNQAVRIQILRRSDCTASAHEHDRHRRSERLRQVEHHRRDNSDGLVVGEYANFNEISVKRNASRDGQSQYYLNGARCRRRDITDLFLGTGLGARSYSIIEQGMISEIISAHPDELRGHLEEAAGISKYKERRKETESRIKATRENLERLNDVREEVEKQLEHLNRQAKAAALAGTSRPSRRDGS
jgi:chromosome segregation ATPase